MTPKSGLLHVDDNVITLKGIIDISLFGVVLIIASLAAPFVAWRFWGWWPALLLVVWPFILARLIYQATITRIEFLPGSVFVRRDQFPASRVGPFVCRYFSDTPGLADKPGHIEIWLADHLHTETFVATMDASADASKILQILNAKLEQARR